MKDETRVLLFHPSSFILHPLFLEALEELVEALLVVGDGLLGAGDADLVGVVGAVPLDGEHAVAGPLLRRRVGVERAGADMALT